MTLKELLGMRETIEKLYRRNYANARQTALISRQLNPIRDRYQEHDETLNKYVKENAKNGVQISVQDDGVEMIRATNKYMDALLKEDIDVNLRRALKWKDIDALDNGKQKFSGDELDVLITLGLLLDLDNEEEAEEK